MFNMMMMMMMIIECTYNNVCTTHYFCYHLNDCLLNVAFLDIIIYCTIKICYNVIVNFLQIKNVFEVATLSKQL